MCQALCQPFDFHLLQCSPQPYEVGNVIIPILQMKQMSHKEAQYLAQSYSVTKKQIKDLSPEVQLQSPCT